MPDLTKYGKPVCQLTGTDECKWHFICKVLEEPVEDLDNCPDGAILIDYLHKAMQARHKAMQARKERMAEEGIRD